MSASAMRTRWQQGRRRRGSRECVPRGLGTRAGSGGGAAGRRPDTIAGRSIVALVIGHPLSLREELDRAVMTKMMAKRSQESAEA